MRNYFYLAFLVLFFASCKKDKGQDQPPVVKTDWTSELKNSVWTGELQYVYQFIRYPQPYSIVFGNDNTAQIFDIQSVQPCTWSVVDSTVTIHFSSTTIKADVGKEKWKNFESLSSNVYNLFSAGRSSIPDPVALAGTVWKGMLAGYDLQVEFLADKKMKITQAKIPGSPLTVSYLVSGAGILFSIPYPGVSIQMSMYGCFFNGGMEFRGISYGVGLVDYIYNWNATKQ